MNHRAIAAEALGATALLVAVVGSGIMGEQLAQGNAGVALLGNSIATGCALFVLITLLGPLSGAHFNPLVTLFASGSESPIAERIAKIAAQFAGGIAGVAIANAMFALPLLHASRKARNGAALWLGEIVATAGLLFLIIHGSRVKPALVPAMVALYITGAYWFTSSTSFANPAVTVARALSDTFAGIHPQSVAGFIVAQVVGAALGIAAARWFRPRN